MIDLRAWLEVAIGIIIMSVGAWIGYASSLTEIVLLTLGCFLIDAVVYVLAVTFDRSSYYAYMIMAMVVTGSFLASMWITCGVTEIVGLFIN